ncbi:MAG: tetratricopeptide repeat protein [Chitinophagaceae bacterium]|nr:tetratricopeptide repeat protein [Chitinophagaceae bacterium]
MKRIAKIFISIICCMILISSCTDKGTDSPFADILSQPPYAPLTDSIKKQPKNDNLYFRRAVLLNTGNLPEPALADFKKAWSLKKEEKYALGLSNLLLDKNPDSAIIFLKQALNELPNSLLLQLTLARSLTTQEKTDEALKICDGMLQKNPEQVDVLKMKAGLLDKKGKNTEAINTLEKAYSLAPFDVELNYMYALKLAETGNKRVLSLCDSLILADSLELHAEPYYYKGIYFSNRNEKVKALSLFDEAIKHDYYFLDGYIEKGAVYYDLKKFPEALRVFNLALTVSPKFADGYYWAAKCQEAMGNKEEAKENYLRAYSLDKNLAEAKAAADTLK